MSLKLNSSGGGSVTLQEPTTASNRTINLPDVNATVLTDSAGVMNIGSGQVYKDASGNVGFGTTSPAVKVNAVGSIAASDSTTPAKRLQLDMGASSGTINCANYGTGMLDLNVQGQTVIFNTGLIGVAERARIDSSGNLLVGTTSAFSSGRVCFDGGNNAYVPLNCRVTQTTSASQIGFVNGNGVVGSISTNGSSTAYNTSSDYRLKRDISPMTGALARVSALNPVTYKWKVDDSHGEGFIAHELAEVVPGCVTGEKDAVDAEGNPIYQGIDTSFLVATLTAAIQEQQAMIEELKARVASLEGV